MTCSKQDSNDAKRIITQRTKGVKFFCNVCNVTVDQFSELKSMQMDMEKHFTKLELRSYEIYPQIYEKFIPKTKVWIGKENNLIVYKVVESSSDADMETVVRMFETLEETNVDYSDRICSVRRVGKPNVNKHRLLCVRLDSLVLVKAMLKTEERAKEALNHLLGNRVSN